jgi:hypothetical protein
VTVPTNFLRALPRTEEFRLPPELPARSVEINIAISRKKPIQARLGIRNRKIPDVAWIVTRFLIKSRMMLNEGRPDRARKGDVEEALKSVILAMED